MSQEQFVDFCVCSCCWCGLVGPEPREVEIVEVCSGSVQEGHNTKQRDHLQQGRLQSLVVQPEVQPGRGAGVEDRHGDQQDCWTGCANDREEEVEDGDVGGGAEVLEVKVKGRDEHVGVDVEGEGDEDHGGQHDHSRADNSEFVVLVGLVVQDVRQQHCRERQPEHEIPSQLQTYTEMFLPAMVSSLISCMSELVRFLSEATTGLFSARQSNSQAASTMAVMFLRILSAEMFQQGIILYSRRSIASRHGQSSCRYLSKMLLLICFVSPRGSSAQLDEISLFQALYIC